MLAYIPAPWILWVIHYHTISIYIYIYISIYISIYILWLLVIPQKREKGLGNHQITHGRWPKCAARGKVEPSLAKAFRRAFEGFREWDLVRLPKQPLFWLWIDEDSKILLRENVLQYNSIVYIYMIIWLYIWLYDYIYIYECMIIYIYDYIYMFGVIYYM